MIAKLGVTYVVVGHSERREYHAEDDALVNAKAIAALQAGMSPIICVGEGIDVRDAGQQVAHTVAQVEGAFAGISAEDAARCVVAYEPVWAIGTGKVATPADAQEVCGAIRQRLAELYGSEVAQQIRVLYGGPVKAAHIAAITGPTDVEGAVAGGEGPDAAEIPSLVRYRDPPGAVGGGGDSPR